MEKEDYEQLILVFVTTAVWDVVLRYISLGTIHIPVVSEWEWVHVLKPYFKKHTVLGAALLAGAAGAAAQIAMWILPPTTNPAYFVFQVAMVSALIGWPMYISGLYPELKRYYYDKLQGNAVISDALSGIVVMVSIFLMGLITNRNRRN